MFLPAPFADGAVGSILYRRYTLSTPLGEAIRVLGIYTAGTYDIWSLAGRAKASCRAHVLSTLLGKSISQSKARVNVVVDTFYAQCQIGGGSPSERESNFVQYCENWDDEAE